MVLLLVASFLSNPDLDNVTRQAKHVFQWPVLNHCTQPLSSAVRLNKFRLWHAPTVQMACFNDRVDMWDYLD